LGECARLSRPPESRAARRPFGQFTRPADVTALFLSGANVVLDAPPLHRRMLHVVPRIGGARVLVARLPDAPRIGDDPLRAQHKTSPGLHVRAGHALHRTLDEETGHVTVPDQAERGREATKALRRAVDA